ncbi:MAG: hypothetical protein U0166_04865 [Acidobacteriota bacterium]
MLGRTRDDAAGESFDKLGKALGLPYPAGPLIDKLSEGGRAGRVALPRTRIPARPLDMSFSGLKTAAIRAAAALPSRDPESGPVRDLLAEFQEAVVDILASRVKLAAGENAVRSVLVTGGVAANRRLRSRLAELGDELGLPVHFPAMALTTDNAAMIAAAGAQRLLAEGPDALSIDALPTWDLETLGAHP